MLIALASARTGLQWGIAPFTVITALGLSLRSYLEHLKLQMPPRFSVVLTFQVVDDRGDQPVQPQARLRERPRRSPCSRW
ncbi:7TM domain-containing protein [Pseudomonas aeruginosa]